MSNFNKDNRPLQKMFSSIPGRYDLMNRLLTFRMDEVWRKKAAQIIAEEKPDRFLDLCCGTADLAVRLAGDIGDSTDIYGMDFSLPMLIKAREKIQKISNQVNLVLADAAKMPFADSLFDIVGISFAFRNLTWKNPNRELFLSEIYRIIKPGGIFIIIESSQPNSKIVKFFFNLHLEYIVSRFGGFLSGHKAAYRYLARSASEFYNNNELGEILTNAGFLKNLHIPLFFGASAITIVCKPHSHYTS